MRKRNFCSSFCMVSSIAFKGGMEKENGTDLVMEKHKTNDKQIASTQNPSALSRGQQSCDKKGHRFVFLPPPFLFCASKRLVVSTRTPLPPCGSKASLHNNKTEEEHWAENGLVVHVRCKCCSCSNGGSGCHHQLRMTAGRGVHGRLFFFQFNSTLDIAAI